MQIKACKKLDLLFLNLNHWLLSIAKLRSLLEQKGSKKNLHGSNSSGIDANNGSDPEAIQTQGSGHAEQDLALEGGGSDVNHEAAKFLRDDCPTKPSHDLQDL